MDRMQPGDRVRIEGKLYDVNGNFVKFVGNEPVTYLYTEPGQYYNGCGYNERVFFDVDGEKMYCNTWLNDIGRLNVKGFITKNGKPAPDPRGQEDVDLATIGLVAAMGVSSIFVGAPLWWATELYYYTKYRKKKLYPDIDKKDWRKKK